MLAEGSRVPAVTAIDEELHPVDLSGLAADGPFMLVFYLYDWTRT
jgi:peroxiredoxin